MQPREKLKRFIEREGLNNTQFAEIVEKPRQYITNVLNGTKGFGLDFVILLGYKFPHLDLNWLLKEEGDDENIVPSSLVSEQKISYNPKSQSKKDNRDKIIEQYEKLCSTQQSTIYSLQEVIAAMAKKK